MPNLRDVRVERCSGNRPILLARGRGIRKRGVGDGCPLVSRKGQAACSEPHPPVRLEKRAADLRRRESDACAQMVPTCPSSRRPVSSGADARRRGCAALLFRGER